MSRMTKPAEPFAGPARGRIVRAATAGAVAAAGATAWLTLAGSVLAHGIDDPPEPSLAAFLVGWSFDPTIQIPILVVAAAYLWAVRHVDAAHPANPVPWARTACFLGGLATIEIALQSGIDAYENVLFSDHMVQHILLTMIAAPLLAAGAPITLLLRVARPEARRRWILPVLHSRVVRAISFPVVAWVLFAAVMWGTHFSPLFEASLENPLVHDLEHVLFLSSALLFWWPVVGLDPSPWRMPHPVRALYAGLQMPQNTFLALAILSATAPLYRHYATLDLAWLPDPLADQQAAAAIMWVVGDLTFFVAILLIVRAWMVSEDRATHAADARLDAEESRLRERAESLATRRLAAADPVVVEARSIDGGIDPQASGSGAAR